MGIPPYIGMPPYRAGRLLGEAVLLLPGYQCYPPMAPSDFDRLMSGYRLYWGYRLMGIPPYMRIPPCDFDRLILGYRLNRGTAIKGTVLKGGYTGILPWGYRLYTGIPPYMGIPAYMGMPPRMGIPPYMGIPPVGDTACWGIPTAVSGGGKVNFYRYKIGTSSNLDKMRRVPCTCCFVYQ